jgi:uncharacterized membrane protein
VKLALRRCTTSATDPISATESRTAPKRSSPISNVRGHKKDAVIPREEREDSGGDKHQLVLAFFDTEDAADQAAKALRDWEKATEYMKVDAVGVLVKGDGKVKEHKLGKRAGKRGMGIGVALGLIAAIPSGGLSLAGGDLGGAAGGGVIGQFFHKDLKMTDEDTARIGRELDAGHAVVGVLTWDFETESVSKKLTGWAGPLRPMKSLR